MDDSIEQTVYSAPSEVHAPEQQFEQQVSGGKVIRFPDGSAVLEDTQTGPQQQDQNNHDQNLAEVLPSQIVREIGFSLKEAIKEDKESQEDYFEAVGRIIELLGIKLTSESDEDLPFDGAAKIYSMALYDASLDILAGAISSLFPATGMADCVITGEASEETRDRAYRKKSFFNHYFDHVAKEFKKEVKRTLMWASFCGSNYMKVYIDPTLGRPTAMFIRPDDFILNREYTTHLIASRKTHVLRMDARELQIRRMKGIYSKTPIMKQDGYRDGDNVIQEEINEISGFNPTSFENDDIYCIYECHVDYRIKEDVLAPEFEIALPYIISIDEKSGEVLSIRRNWQQGDYLKKKREYFVNFSLLPSLDGEGYGLMHYAGRQAEAATSITRQLINTAAYANFPGGVYMAGMRLENNNLRPSPGEFVPIQTGGIPIDQAISPLPYKEPSQTYISFLDRIEDNIKKPTSIVNSKIAELAPRAPGMTTLGMMEAMQKVPNAILQGFHESFQQLLMLFNDRFAEWLPAGQPYPFKVPDGDHAIMKEDFSDSIIVVPASDPSLQNSSFRFLQSEIILNQAHQSPDVHDMRRVYAFFYKNMGLSPEDVKAFLPEPTPPAEIIPLDPITENQALMQGQPTRSGVSQDHDAHITVHSLLLADPNTKPEIVAGTNAHIQEHKAQKFLVEMQAKIGFVMPENPAEIPPEIQNQIAVMAAQVAQQELAQMNQGQPQEPPLDPARVELEYVRSKNEIDKMRLNIDEQKVHLEAHKIEVDAQIEQERLRQKADQEHLKSQLDNKKIELDAAYKEKDLMIKEIKSLHEQLQQKGQEYAQG